VDGTAPWPLTDRCRERARGHRRWVVADRICQWESIGTDSAGAGHFILVIGSQNLIPDVAAGLRGIYEYSFPLKARGLERRMACRVVSTTS
jgi:hypothetical protein